MSFSFTVRAPSKPEAKAAVSAKLDETVTAQPIHEADRALVEATAGAYIDMIEEPGDRDIHVTVNGWVQGDFDARTFSGASVNVTASLVVKE